MKVTATITIGTIETRVQGESPFLEGRPGDSLERKGLGFWLDRYSLNGNGRRQKGRVFVPWTSCLYLEERNGGKSE